MNKFYEWFGHNRKTIGYTVGGINLLGGVLAIINGNTTNGVIGLLLGAAIVFDTRTFK